MHGTLLHRPVHWRAQDLELCLLMGLDKILRETVGLLVELAQLVEYGSPKFGHGLCLRLGDRRNRRLSDFLLPLLHQEFLLLLGQRLQHLEVLQLRAQFGPVQLLPDLEALLHDRKDRLEFGNGCANGRRLGFLLLALASESRDPGAMFRDLAREEPLLVRDLIGLGTEGRLERIAGFAFFHERCAKPGDIELGRQQIRLQQPRLGLIDRRIDLDQHLARLDPLSVLDKQPANHADLHRLDHLDAIAWHDLTRCRCDDIDLAQGRPCHR
jgi:hypothetical protein